MPSKQENYRREQFQSSLENTARFSERLHSEIKSTFSSYIRDKSIIDSRLSDSNLTDNDYFHNGAKSVTIGEAKTALRAVLSYAVHVGDISESDATSHMSDAGISDNTVVATEKISSDLETLNF
jgi:uncharacterized sporulation protein YeaH/YhbH (DUF444 family)